MDREQWGRFTDFGVTVLDSAGRQLAQDPLEYAFGRLSTVAPGGTRRHPRGADALPGLRGSGGRPAVERDRDHPTVCRLGGGGRAGDRATGEAIARTGAARLGAFPAPARSWPMPQGFAPLGVVLARVGEQVWTRESGFVGRSGR